MKLLKKILNRLFGYKWICEYCGAIEYCMEQPFCKGNYVLSYFTRFIKTNNHFKLSFMLFIT